MKEVKQPSKKPLVYYYLVALLILMVLNLTLFPAMLETPVQDVTYDQFMSMTYEQNVGQVQIEGDEITFTDKTNEKVYRTTATNDPDRTQRLYENGAQFQACSPPSWWAGSCPCSPSCSSAGSSTDG